MFSLVQPTAMRLKRRWPGWEILSTDFLMKFSFLNGKFKRWVKNGHFQMLKNSTDILRHLDFSVSPSFVHVKGHPEKVPNDRHYSAVIQRILLAHIFLFSIPKNFHKSMVSVFLPTSYTRVVNLYSIHSFWIIMFHLKLAVDYLLWFTSAIILLSGFLACLPTGITEEHQNLSLPRSYLHRL